MSKNNRSPFSLSTQRLFFLLSCLVLVLFAVFVRTWKFSEIPATLYIDEVAMLVDAKALVTTGKDMHGNSWLQTIFPSYGDYKMPVYLWFVYGFAALFSPSNWVVRFPSLLAGFGTIAIVYGLLRTLPSLGQSSGPAKKYVSKEVALFLALLVVGCSPWAIQFARTGFEAHLAQFLLGLGVLVLLRSKKRMSYLLVATAFAVLATYTYFSVRYVWMPVYAVWALVQFDISFKKIWKKQISSLVRKVLVFIVPALVFGLLLIPMITSPLYSQSVQFRLSTPSVLQNADQVVQANVYREYAGNSILDRIFFHRWYFTAQELAENMSQQLSPAFIFIWGDQNLRHGTGKYGLFLLPFIVPAFVGLYVFAKKYKKVLLVLAAWIVAAALPAAVPLEVPHALRFLNALIPLALLISVGVYECGVWMLRQKIKAVKILALMLSSSVVAFYVASYSCYYFSVYPHIIAEAWDREKTELAVAVSPFISVENRMYISAPHDKFFLWILAYGPFSGSEFAGWQSDAYQFNDLGAVIFGMPTTFESQDRVVLSKSSLESLFNSKRLMASQYDVLTETKLSSGDIYYTLEIHE